MMQRRLEKEYETRDYRIKYVCMEDHICITDYNGVAVEIEIPNRIDNYPVTVIEKKVFLSRKKLRRVVLPETLTEIGDWAFAYCDQLEEVTFPGKAFNYGKGIFLNCSKLKKIHFVCEGVELQEDISVLMAVALVKFDAYYLFDPVYAGKREWLEKWDFRLQTLMEQEDMEGYTRTVLCGEEDYGSKENDIDFFLDVRRREKVRMAMLRLLHPFGLEESLKQKLKEYLFDHRAGEATGEQTWQVVLSEHPDDPAYYELMWECGCMNEANMEGMITALGSEHAEMKAWLLQIKQQKLTKHDFFDFFSIF